MSGKESILVIDDEPKILELVKSYLEKNGFTALCATSGKEGMALFEQKPVSMILLDLMLPDLPGEDFCRKVHEASDVPIIMITAKVDEASIIRGLSLGADDYVCKPFSPRQLMARIQAVLRRSGGTGSGIKKSGTFLSYKDLSIDSENRIVSLGGKVVNLTKDEYNILSLLMTRQTKIFTREEILQVVKGDDFEGFDRAVDTHIKKIRAKIGGAMNGDVRNGDNPTEYIVTVYGMGYRLGVPE